MVFAQRVGARRGERAQRPEGAAAGRRVAHRILSGLERISLNNEAIQIFHVPAAHSDGDSLVFFRRSDVVVTGDIFVTTSLSSDRQRRQHQRRDCWFESHH